jgi:O-antigen/teichoic acid export membrane protein
LAREILGFTSWTLFGQVSTVFRNQAVTVLINQFFNPATVAARAIAMTVAYQALVFSQYFNTGLYSPIIRAYAADQKAEMNALVLNGSKLTFFLMWIFALPMMLEMDTILRLWLVTPPSEAIMFTRLALIESLIMSLSLPLGTAARAPGKMKLYELTLGSIQIAIFACSWLALTAGYSAASVFIIAIVANLLMFKIRLLLVKGLVGLPIASYYTQVIIPLILVILLSSVAGIMAAYWLADGLLASVMVVGSCIVTTIVTMYFFGLDKLSRRKLQNIIAVRLAVIRGDP